jgi:hypothetical protein
MYQEVANGPYHNERSSFPRLMTDNALFLWGMRVFQRRTLPGCMTEQACFIRLEIGMKAIERNKGRLLSGG